MESSGQHLMKWAVKARSLQVHLSYCWPQRDGGGGVMVSPHICSRAAGRDPCSRSQPLLAQPCRSLPSPPQEHMTAGGNCQTFSSSTVISYSNTGDGAPKVYQETSEMRSAPGGVSWGAAPVPGRHGQGWPGWLFSRGGPGWCFWAGIARFGRIQ